MGILNAHAFFATMTADSKQLWNEQFRHDPARAIKIALAIVQEKSPHNVVHTGTADTVRRLEAQIGEAIKYADPNSEVIVDDLMDATRST
jgi:hypothetical protein